MTALNDLLSGDEDRAEAALKTLTPNDLPALGEALASSASPIRLWAVEGVGGLRVPESIALLLQYTADPDADVRAAVFYMLGERRAEEAIGPLIFALSDKNSYLQRIATDALIHIGAPAVPALIDALDHDVQTTVRVHLARALALIADQRAIPALFRAIEDESYLVQHWVTEGLERMGVGQVYFKV